MLDFLTYKSTYLTVSFNNLLEAREKLKKLYGKKLIRNKWLEVAAKLLVKSDYTVSEISVLTGFNSHAYFSNSFKLVYV